jgi:polyphosphate kinase 2
VLTAGFAPPGRHDTVTLEPARPTPGGGTAMDEQDELAAAVEAYCAKKAPKAVRAAVKGAKGPILPADYPYPKPMKAEDYEATHARMQLELVRMQSWVKATGARVAVILEGRDAAGKGGAIKRLTECLNPRVAHIVALSKPSDVERGQWYFQRYVAQLPGPGEIMFFDRSWYNRAVVEHVFGFCTEEERSRFFDQAPRFEAMLVEDGLILMKIWLVVNRAEQLRRFLDRARDPLKLWKLSRIDVDGLDRWDEYTEAIRETYRRTHTGAAPWTIVRADDKRRARIEVMRTVLAGVPYAGKPDDGLLSPDERIAVPSDLVRAATA